MTNHPPKTAALGVNGVAFLDLLRAAAANVVLLGHASDIFGLGLHVPLGSIGVGVFFILSGFLILQSSMARLERPGPRFWPFLIDRFARIFTAYVPALVLVAAIGSQVDLGRWGQEGVSSGPLAFVGNLLLLQDYPLFQALSGFAGDPLRIRPYNTAEPFWTIPIEFWIYVVFGLGFFGLAARERLGRVSSTLLGAIALPVVAWNAAAGGGNGLSLVWLIGAAGSYMWASGWRRGGHRVQVGAVVLFVAAACLLGRGLKTGWNFQDAGMAICETLCLLGALSIMEGIPALPRGVRAACTFLASYSYSLYLIHNTVLVVFSRPALASALGAAAFPAALLAAHVLAFVLYLLFERRYRHVGAWLKRRRMAYAPAPSAR